MIKYLNIVILSFFVSCQIEPSLNKCMCNKVMLSFSCVVGGSDPGASLQGSQRHHYKYRLQSNYETIRYEIPLAMIFVDSKINALQVHMTIKNHKFSMSQIEYYMSCLVCNNHFLFLIK